MTFAFCPGKNAKEHVLGMDKRKAPEVVGRSVRKTGPSMKIAFGTAKVEQRVFELTCEKVLPAMAKKVKMCLKASKVMLNVRILGPDGQVLEEDIEELPPEEAEDLVDLDEEDEDEPGPEQTQETEDAPEIDKADLSQRLKSVREGIKGAPNGIQKKLLEAFAKVLAQVKERAFEDAIAGLDRLEKALAKLQEVSQGQGTAGISSEDTSPPVDQGELQQPEPVPEAPPTTPNSRLLQACETLQTRIADIGNAKQREALENALTTARRLINSGEVEKAIAAIKRIQGALAKLGEGTAARKKVLPIWAAAKDETDTQLSALQNQLRGDGHPVFAAIADKGLHGITSGELTAMMRATMDYDGAGADTLEKATTDLRGSIGRMREFLTRDKGVALLDGNQMDVTVTLRDTLGDALNQIEETLG
ncbi:MAG: hypothetical protein AB3N23_01065 [Paracoccaceae bacterium]